MRVLTACIVTAALLCAHCSSSQVAGGGETTNGIAAVVLLPGGSPASGATVTLRPANYLSGTVEQYVMAETVTGSDGGFELTGIERGAYSIEVNDRAGLALLLLTELPGGGTTVRLPADTLRPYATVLGTAPFAALGTVTVYGLERSVPIDAAGSFSLDDLPQGRLRVRIAQTVSGSEPPRIDSVLARAGDTVHLPFAQWRFSRELELNPQSAASLDQSLAAFPLLLTLSGMEIDFASCRGNGADLRFSTARGDELAHEIELWDSAGSQAAVWVLLDTLHASDSHFIRMHWGNSLAPATSRAATVFDTSRGHAAVWHMDGQTGVFTDATAHANDGIPSVSASAQHAIAGMGQRFDGVDDIIDCGTDPSLDYAGAITLSAWVFLDDLQMDRYQRIVSKKRAWDDTAGYEFECNPHAVPPGDTTVTAGITLIGRDTTLARGFVDWTPGWHHCAITSQGTDVTVYFDGVAVDSTQLWNMLQQPLPSATPLRIGGVGNADYLQGVLDEVRICSVPRSAGWIRVCYENQRPDSRLVRFR